jgi:hypothetical protein
MINQYKAWKTYMDPEINALWFILWFVLYAFRLQFMKADYVFPHHVFFSTWVLWWALFYWAFTIYYEGTPKTEMKTNIIEYANPAVALLISISYQVYTFVKLCIYSSRETRRHHFINWLLKTIIMKIIPFYFVSQYLVSWTNSLLASLIAVVLFIVHHKHNNIHIVNLYAHSNDYYKKIVKPKYQF